MLGIGTDIVSIKRIESILNDPVALPSFLSRTYTAGELHIINQAPSPPYRYATHFAGKEAVFKAMDLDSNVHFYWNEIEICYRETGRPYVLLHGYFNKIAMEQNISSVSISLSYESDYAVAFAIAEHCC